MQEFILPKLCVVSPAHNFSAEHLAAAPSE